MPFSFNNLPEKVYIFDTTLRDGEQTPGVALTIDEKIEIAHLLDELRVDVIEAGFPIASEGEAKAVQKIANEGLKAKICALARTKKEDIDKAIDCGVSRIHTFIATSEIHMKYKLHMEPSQVLEKAVWAVEYIKDHGIEVEFSAEDATRTRLEFLKEVFTKVTEAGASYLDIPDTVGVAIPIAMKKIVSEVRTITKANISVHCHNDMGLAVANTLAGIEEGAIQPHCCVNGLGERAGNAALEEVAVALKYMYGVKLNLDYSKIYETSQKIMRLTGVPLAPNKAVVGANAFSHESGIHAHGVIESPMTYEPISPEDIGAKSRILAGKQSGAHGIGKILENLGFKYTPEQLKLIVEKIKMLGDKGITVTEADISSIARSVIQSLPPHMKKIKLEDILVVTGNKINPTATVKLHIGGKPVIVAANGVGPIDAAINAIRNASEEVAPFKLKEFRLEAITGGTQAVAETIVTIEDEKKRSFTSRGSSEDIVIAGVEAIIEAINKLMAES
ncbi:MAG: 2-isopropylmalate synthase [Candidatus Odinarchaeum yellowstonii]|uniref:2-isopropylmalate synthase n=1 Tax=Odinarchaeota yellowstonii (strain LCB_4) TaxID=1841599 RepID=A0AAF0D3X0_ODILC|nr:MAG: 2-isopropylmalate synthase [Candidatus Odinarchaeum yellowstonii]